MTNLLVKTFIKNYRDTSNNLVRRAYGFLASVVGILCNVLLCASKITIGLLFNSIAILADGINNLSDAASSIVTLFGFKLAGQPADEKHPYGHARFEYISGLIIAFIILMVSFQLVSSSIEKIVAKGEMQASFISIGILGGSILVKLWMCLFYRKLGKTISSTTLSAASIDSRNDVFATIAVLLSSVIAMTAKVNLDGYFGIAVGLFVFYSGIKLCKDTLSPLLGEKPPKNLTNKILEIITSFEGVKGVHDMMIHNYGPNKFYASIHVEVDSKVSILVSHDTIDRIEKEVGDKLSVCLVIHLDPIVLDDPKTDELKQIAIEAILEVDKDFSLHDFRAVLGNTHTNLIFDLVVPLKCNMSDDEIKRNVQEKLCKQNPTLQTVIAIDRNYIGD